MPANWRQWIVNSTAVLPALSSGDYKCTVTVSGVAAAQFGGRSTISYDVTIYIASGSLQALSTPGDVSAAAASEGSLPGLPDGFGFLGPPPELNL